jgi:hypothetical protein
MRLDIEYSQSGARRTSDQKIGRLIPAVTIAPRATPTHLNAVLRLSALHYPWHHV